MIHIKQTPQQQALEILYGALVQVTDARGNAALYNAILYIDDNPQGCREKLDAAQHEPDYGGAFDGSHVSSDADPGL